MTPPSGPGGSFSAPAGRARLQRPNTVAFEIPGPTSSRQRYPEVAREIGRKDFADDVSCLQPRGSQSFILSFESQVNALRLLEEGITVAGNHYDVSQVTGGTTVITIYDAPYELPHAAIKHALAHYGEVKSVEHVKAPADIGNFFNGDRKAVISMRKPVPNILIVDGFEVTCWYRKVTKLCRRCGGTDHLAAACPTPAVPAPKRCGNCGNRWHETRDCKGCFTCKTEAHSPDTCPNLVIKMEVTEQTVSPVPSETPTITPDSAPTDSCSPEFTVPATTPITPQPATQTPDPAPTDVNCTEQDESDLEYYDDGGPIAPDTCCSRRLSQKYHNAYIKFIRNKRNSARNRQAATNEYNIYREARELRKANS